MCNRGYFQFRKPIVLLLILSVLLTCFSSCTVQNDIQTEPSDAGAEGRALRILSGSVLDLYGPVVDAFLEGHEDVEIEIEIIPSDPEEQEVFLEQLRVEIMAGNGPDVYLMSHDDRLFADVAQSIRNGIFLDLSGYYDADTGLNKSGFNAAVMNAGVVNGGRYVLPLRYNMPILCVDGEKLADAGLGLDRLGTGLSGLTEVVQTLGKESLVMEPALTHYYLINLMPEITDYETQEVIVPKATLAEFLDEYRSLISAVGASNIPWAFPSYTNYISHDEYWAKDGGCVHMTSLQFLIENLKLSKAAGTDLTVLPLCASDGTLTASVTHYVAVSSGCDDPELAYEFVREFLMPDSQWHSSAMSFPVLVEDAWADLDRDLWLPVSKLGIGTAAAEGAAERKQTLRDIVLTEEDFAVLNAEIGRVLLPLAATPDYMTQIDAQLNPVQNPDAMNVDVEELAEKLIWNLQWRLAEG